MIDFSKPLAIVQLILMLLLIGCGLYIIFRLLRRKFAVIFFSVSTVFLVVSYILDLFYLFIFCTSIITIVTILFLFVNIGEIRPLVANPLASKKKVRRVAEDSTDLYKKIQTAVRYLSMNKTGAIITFERNTSLNDFIKSGSVINCPVTPEILETIFYEGTRLHDGAVVIRGTTIVAAAVFYPPSTRGLTGKYGARHRAALGISEITDSITIIVSEETGRITLAYAGILEPVVLDEFERVFADAMNSVANPSENQSK